MQINHKIKSGISVLCLGFLLSGCAGPSTFQILSFAADGISYLATEKTITDHGISAITQKDCKMMRTLKGEAICMEGEMALQEEAEEALDPDEELENFPEEDEEVEATSAEPLEPEAQ